MWSTTLVHLCTHSTVQRYASRLRLDYTRLYRLSRSCGGVAPIERLQGIRTPAFAATGQHPPDPCRHSGFVQRCTAQSDQPASPPFGFLDMSTPPSTSPTSKLAWTDAPSKHLARLAWPICISMLSYAVYSIIDTWFVAGLGEAALAGVSLGGVLCFTGLWFAMGLLQAVKLTVSRDIGSGTRQHIDVTLAAGLRVAILLGLLFLVASWMIAPFVHQLADSLAAGEAATNYLLIRMAGGPLFLAATALREALYGQSLNQLALRGSLIGSAANILFDAIAILILDWGVEGVAVATVAAYACEFAALWLFESRRRRQTGLEPLPPLTRLLQRSNRGREQALIRLGWPIGVQNFFEVGAFLILTTIIARAGDDQLAAHQITLQLLHFGFLPVLAMGEAACVMVSEALGADEKHWVWVVARRSMVLTTSFTLTMAAVFGLGGPWIIELFGIDGELAQLCRQLLLIAALFQISDGFNIVGRCVLRGVRDIRFVVIVTAGFSWLATCPLAYLFALELGWGARGGWWALTCEIFIVSVILWVRLWRRHGGRRLPASPGV